MELMGHESPGFLVVQKAISGGSPETLPQVPGLMWLYIPRSYQIPALIFLDQCSL